MKMKIKKLVDLIRWETKRERRDGHQDREFDRRRAVNLDVSNVEVRKLIPVGYWNYKLDGLTNLPILQNLGPLNKNERKGEEKFKKKMHTYDFAT